MDVGIAVLAEPAWSFVVDNASREPNFRVAESVDKFFNLGRLLDQSPQVGAETVVSAGWAAHQTPTSHRLWLGKPTGGFEGLSLRLSPNCIVCVAGWLWPLLAVAGEVRKLTRAIDSSTPCVRR